jgi:cyclohexanone monooxygenase
MTDSKSLDIAIIGAGAGGIMAAIKLRDSCHRVTVFEKESDLGGTWRDNTYPGLVCDVPSHLYRFSFEPNAEWSRTFSPGSEIYDYVRAVAEKHEVEQLIRYDSEIVSMHYADGRWSLETLAGYEGRFDVVVSAVGILHHPVYPDIEGLETFGGDAFHSARWNHDVSLHGKRIGIVGTGSTAVQIVGAVVDDVASLTLFQRTAQWVFPAPNLPHSEDEKAAMRDDPALMATRYDELANALNHGFAAAVVGENDEALAGMQAACEQNLNDNVPDPVLRERLRPDYSAGCKRLIVSDQFYPAICRDNAHLVTSSIARVEPTGIRTEDGILHELDVLVLATGFDPHRFLTDAKVVGKEGVRLNDIWSRGNYAYKTICIPGFPNLFFLGGPNSPIGNFSYLLTAETQLGYIEQLISLISTGALKEVTPKADVTTAFNDELKQSMAKTVWASGCQSWYFDKHGNVASWPWTFERFEQAMTAPDLADFESS